MMTSITLKEARTAERTLGIVRDIPKPSLKEVARILDRDTAGGAQIQGLIKIQPPDPSGSWQQYRSH